MPRFNDSFLAPLKATMLHRLPECVFTADDIIALSWKGLITPQIQTWEDNFRRRYVTTEQREAFLRAEKTDEKVRGRGNLMRKLHRHSLGFNQFSTPRGLVGPKGGKLMHQLHRHSLDSKNFSNPSDFETSYLMI